MLEPKQSSSLAFSGYPKPSSNTLYCPNQFFDVVLKHRSRGVIRIVSYMLRRTLGWSKKDGTPQESKLTITHKELIDNAGVSKGALKKALTEAQEAGFINCLLNPTMQSKNVTAISAIYELNWAPEDAPYSKDLANFQGFFAGAGHRTYIPNQFFDYTIVHEKLSVIKVVGSIIRLTIGFQTKYGFRRQEIELSARKIAAITGLSLQKTQTAISLALSNGHIKRPKTASFKPGQKSSGSTYTINWEEGSCPDRARRGLERGTTAETAVVRVGRCGGTKETERIAARESSNGDKLVANKGGSKRTTEKLLGQKRFKKDYRAKTVQNGALKRFNKDKQNSSKKTTATVQKGEQIQITKNNNLNNNNKTLAAALIKVGFTPKDALYLISHFESSIITEQLKQLPQRIKAEEQKGRKVENKLGLLRASIQNNFSAVALPGKRADTRSRPHWEEDYSNRPERRLIGGSKRE